MEENTFPKVLIPVIAGVLGLGILTGFMLSRSSTSGPAGSSSTLLADINGTLAKGGEYGLKDTASLDTATGVLQKGGLDGEGTHQLVREGGPSQTIYLTSSSLDLDKFTGRKIQIWGQTFKTQKVGWFMDVGKIKILE